MKNIGILWIIAGILSSCSSYKTMVDYDSSKDFSTYSSYSFIRNHENKNINSLYANRVKRAVEDQMMTKGMEKTTRADLLVKIDFKVKQKKYVQSNTTAIGNRPGYYYNGRYHRYGYSRGFATTTRSIESYPEGSLMITFIDRDQKEVVWYGVAKGAFSRKDMDDKMVNKLIEDILKDFPPNHKRIIIQG